MQHHAYSTFKKSVALLLLLIFLFASFILIHMVQFVEMLFNCMKRYVFFRKLKPFKFVVTNLKHLEMLQKDLYEVSSARGDN